MPELPEVETVARQLAPRLVGRRVRRLAVLDPRLRNGRTPRVAGREIHEVRRSGKRVLLGLSPVRGRRDELWLAVHLHLVADQEDHYALTERGAFWIHLMQNYYVLDYIDKVWSRSMREAWPGRIEL